MGVVEYCGQNAIKQAPAGRAVKLYREGNFVVAGGAIALFDATGHLVRRVADSGEATKLSLEGLRKGVYIAQSGGNTLKISVK